MSSVYRTTNDVCRVPALPHDTAREAGDVTETRRTCADALVAETSAAGTASMDQKQSDAHLAPPRIVSADEERR